MRFMMIVKPPPYTGLPAKPELEAMHRYNEELTKAGVLRDLSGLAPTTEAAKVKFNGSKRTIVDGPFGESKELIGGYWIIEVRSRDEAIEWAKRVPFGTDVHPGQEVEIEIRRLMNPSDFDV